MLVQHRLELTFATAHVQEPLTWEMAQRFKDLMFNVGSMNVGIHEADMRIALIAEPETVKAAKVYLRDLGVTVKTVSAHKYKGQLPDVPRRPRRGGKDQPRVERKLWLTVIGARRREPFLWTLARRFNATYKILQCASGEKVAIISMLVWGPAEEVEGVVCYLRDQGINVEYGEVGLSAPFAPIG